MLTEKYVEITGSVMFTILPSSVAMNVEMQAVKRIRFRFVFVISYVMICYRYIRVYRAP